MEQDVAAGENPVRKRLLVADADRVRPGWRRAATSRRSSRTAISFADQHSLSATLDDPRQRKGNHIRHLLFRDPTYKSDERGLRIASKPSSSCSAVLHTRLPTSFPTLKLAERLVSVEVSQIR